MLIECSWYSLFLSLILFTRLVDCGPQGRNGYYRHQYYHDDSTSEGVVRNSSSDSSGLHECRTYTDSSGQRVTEVINEDSSGQRVTQDVNTDSSGNCVAQNINTDSSGWDSPQLYPSDSSQPDEPYSSLVPGGQQSLKPSSIHTSNCQICTISVSVSLGLDRFLFARS